MKAETGRPSDEQKRFATLCETAEVAHLIGGVNVVIAFLLERGYLKPDQVAHYRLPDPATCSHKFIDSTACLRCGWTPPAELLASLAEGSCSPRKT